MVIAIAIARKASEQVSIPARGRVNNQKQPD